MSVIVNTNVQSLVSQRNLSSATSALNKSTTRLSTGKKINSAVDDAAGLFVAKGLESQLSGSQQCQTNIALGINVLQIAEGDLVNIQDNVQRIKDLATQASSGIYSDQARTAMQDEIDARMCEINRIANSSNFNGISLLNGSQSTGMVIQVGAGSTSNDAITVDGDVFKNAAIGKTEADIGTTNAKSLDLALRVNPNATGTNDAYLKVDGTACDRAAAVTDVLANGTDIGDGTKSALNVNDVANARSLVATCEGVLNDITDRRSKLGVAQARLESASAGLATTIENLSAAKSTIMDTDIAAETSNYTKQQILQQISSSVLTQANQAPSIALSLM